MTRRQELQRAILDKISNLIHHKKIEQHFFVRNTNIQRLYKEIYQDQQSGIDIVIPGEADNYICDWCFIDSFTSRNDYFKHVRWCKAGKSWFKENCPAIDTAED